MSRMGLPPGFMKTTTCIKKGAWLLGTCRVAAFQHPPAVSVSRASDGAFPFGSCTSLKLWIAGYVRCSLESPCNWTSLTSVSSEGRGSNSQKPREPQELELDKQTGEMS